MREGDGKSHKLDLIDRLALRFRISRYAVYLGILLVMFAVLQLIKNIFLGVHVDEANWWLQTNHLAFGYFKHPPFVVLQQFIVTRIFGSSPFALRLGSFFFTISFIVVVFVFATEVLDNRKWAFYTTLLILVLPLTNYWTLLGHQDAAFTFFFLITILFIWRAVARSQNNYWYAAGISAGFMVLCNLRSVFFFVGILLFLLIPKGNRFWLRRKEPYLAVLIVVLMFTPTLIWYAIHHFEPIRAMLTSPNGYLEQGVSGRVTAIAKHAGWELLGLSPIIFFISYFGLVSGGYLALVKKDDRFVFLFWISAPTILFFAVTGGTPYWAFPAHIISITAGMGALSIVAERSANPKRVRRWSQALLGAGIAVAIVFSILTNYFFAIGVVHSGWKELFGEVKNVSKVADREPGGRSGFYVAAPYHFIASELGYFGREDFKGYTLAFCVYESSLQSIDNSNYSPWVPLDKLKGKDIIFVDEKANPDGYNTPVGYWVTKLAPHFKSVDKPIIYKETKHGRERVFYIFRCYGFKGAPATDHKGEVRHYVQSK